MWDLPRKVEPYNFHRHNGSLSIMPSYKMRGVINQIWQRIALYIRWQWEIRELDTTYEKIWWWKIKWDKQWYLIREIGYDARQVFFKDNVLAFVSVRDNADGTYTYTLGKVSQFVYFPLKSLYDLMNKKEGIPDDQIDRWWGSDIIWGSPRFNHTRMSPETVEEIINDYFRQNKI